MSRQSVTAFVYDKRGRLLSVGRNSYSKTHPRQAHFARLADSPRKEFLHAEIDAIIRCRRGTPYSIRVVRTTPAGQLGLAKPCPVCELAIRHSGIKEVTYSL